MIGESIETLMRRSLHRILCLNCKVIFKDEGTSRALPTSDRFRTMRVRCVKLLDAYSQPTARSQWITVGASYAVLGIWIEPNRVLLRIVGDDPTPVLFPLEMFEITDGQMPHSWVTTSPAPGCLSLEPASWSNSGFWESFFGGDPEARSIFERERERIVGVESLPGQ
jgi:hypothetical protein